MCTLAPGKFSCVDVKWYAKVKNNYVYIDINKKECLL